MKLATRLIAFLVLTLAALAVVDGYFEYTRDRALIRDDMGRRARLLGVAMGGMLGDVWTSNGMERALELIADTNAIGSEITVRWVWLDAKPNEASAPGTPSSSDVENSMQSGALIDGLATGKKRLYLYFPVLNGESRRGALELSQSTMALSQRAIQTLRRSIARLLAVFLIGTLSIYLIGVRLIGRPLAKLQAKIRRVGLGDLSGPLALPGGHELSQLAEGLNIMCDNLSQSQARVAEETAAKIAAIEQSRHADRLRTVGQLASGVAHELGTPLNVVSGRANLIAEAGLDGPEIKESAEIIAAQANRMTTIIRQLLVFARRDSKSKERVHVESAARQCRAMVESAAKKKGVIVDVSSSSADDVYTDCSPSALQQVLTNLIVNAIQASPPGSAVQVDVGTEMTCAPGAAEDAKRRYVRVDVRDTGEGIGTDALSRVFEPFFTTKDVGEGTGLGLSIVHGILTDYDGWIHVSSEPGEGSCFTFYLPESTT